MPKKCVFYVLSTHWDREWRQSFQELRYDFVRLMDKVLVGFADGRLKGPFHIDGQSVILEDYLEVRPEQRGLINDLASKGMLTIGPWYALPDEFCVSGESLIRNLCMGRNIARSFGYEPSNVGFASDMFGHISQLPQIFTGFGISCAFIWRGLNDHKRNILWQGADGTEIPCYRCGPAGYSSYAYYVGRMYDYEGEIEPKQFFGALEAYLDGEAKTSDIETLLIFDGSDHFQWNEQAYGLLCERMQQNKSPYEIIHTSIDEYFKALNSEVNKIRTKVVGELREPGKECIVSDKQPHYSDMQYVIPGVLSSRYNLKQANSICQNLLCHWAEPFSAFACDAVGAEYPQGFLNAAWKFLLQNHAHDSIGGCSIDQVHKDMAYRFDQCRLIAKKLTVESLNKLSASISGEISDDQLRVVVYNPLPQEFDQITELTLQIPPEWPTFTEFFGYESKPAFHIYGDDGGEIPYQRLAQTTERTTLRARAIKCLESYKTNNVKVAIHLSIPPMGYTTLTVSAATHPLASIRYPSTPGLATSERSMENEKLVVTIESNGTVTLTDKQTGSVYNRLLTFEDSADIGDGWYHGQAVNDQIFFSSASKCNIALIDNGPMLTTFRIRTMMSIPEHFCFDDMARAEKFVDMIIDSYLSLRDGQDYLDVKTIVDNVANDHRLRVLMPTGANTNTYFADSAFDVVERPISLRENNHEYREMEIETKPQQSWTAVHDNQRGLAIVSDGLLESAVRDLPEHPIALTLFRGTQRTIGTDGEPDGQIRGKMVFNYRIVPLNGCLNTLKLCGLGQQISAGLNVVQLRRQDIKIHQTTAVLPLSASFLSIEGDAVISSVQQVSGGLEIRMYNPATEEIVARIDTTARPESMKRPVTFQYVNLESEPLSEACKIDGKITVKFKTKQIITLQLR